MAKGKKLSHEEFTLRAIDKLRNDNYKGIHSVFSGFNQAFREYFGSDPVEAQKALVTKGKIVTVPAKRGVMIYKPEDKPGSEMAKGKKALKAILD